MPLRNSSESSHSRVTPGARCDRCKSSAPLVAFSQKAIKSRREQRNEFAIEQFPGFLRSFSRHQIRLRFQRLADRGRVTAAQRTQSPLRIGSFFIMGLAYFRRVCSSFSQ